MSQKHSNNWDKLKAPARPTQSVIDTYKSLIPEGNIYLLGVTPEIANSYENVLAVDRDIKMIENVWPGDTDTKMAFLDLYSKVDAKVESPANTSTETVVQS